MLRSAAGQLFNILRGTVGINASRVSAIGAVRHSSHSTETDEEFDKRYVDYFSRADIDGWEARKAMNDLLGMDLVPEPQIICAALYACRKLNDVALAIRFLEGVEDKCGDQKKTIMPYILQEIQGTLDELGIETPCELGFDTPELALKTVFEES